jgi:hypothetical protein
MIVKLKMLRELAIWKYNEGKDLALSEHLEGLHEYSVSVGEIPEMGRSGT